MYKERDFLWPDLREQTTLREIDHRLPAAGCWLCQAIASTVEQLDLLADCVDLMVSVFPLIDRPMSAEASK